MSEKCGDSVAGSGIISNYKKNAMLQYFASLMNAEVCKGC